MSAIEIGQRAPSFRLPAAAGGETGPDDFRGRTNVIVWFTKGMSCPFCRQQMSQLARARARLDALHTTVLEVTVSTVAQARAYAAKFPLPFPYLCDPDYRVRKAWALDVRSHSPLWYVRGAVRGMRTPPVENDFGAFGPSPGELGRLLTDDDAGFFVLDRQGLVRYASAGPYGTAAGVRPIPSMEEITPVLEACERGD